MATRSLPEKYVSVDVECVATGRHHDDRAVALVAVVDRHERVLLRKKVKPKEKVMSYLTPLTGLREEDLDDGEELDSVLAAVKSVLGPDLVLVGQGINNDMKWLKLCEGQDYSSTVELGELFKTYNPRFANYNFFSLSHEANTLLHRGETCCDPAVLGNLITFLQKEVPGIYIHSISIGKNPTEDEFYGFYGIVNKEVSEVCDVLANDTKLANGFNAMGFGQGGLFLRALVQRCGKIKVRNLISVGGPQQGVYGLPYCPGHNATLCQQVYHTLHFGVYVAWVQKFLMVAQYWQDPFHEATYRNHCIFLPDINQVNTTNPVYKERMLALNNFVLVKLELDTIVKPRESEWFGFYKPGQKMEVYTLEESDIWKKDLLGLQKLNSTGRLNFISAPFDYLNFTAEWFNTYLLHYVNH